MKRVIVILMMVSGFYNLSAGNSWSANLEKGYAAFKSGGYVTGRREFKPLQVIYHEGNWLGIVFEGEAY